MSQVQDKEPNNSEKAKETTKDTLGTVPAASSWAIQQILAENEVLLNALDECQTNPDKYDAIPEYAELVMNALKHVENQTVPSFESEPDDSRSNRTKQQAKKVSEKPKRKRLGHVALNTPSTTTTTTQSLSQPILAPSSSSDIIPQQFGFPMGVPMGNPQDLKRAYEAFIMQQPLRTSKRLRKTAVKWTDEEHEQLLKLVNIYGKHWKYIASEMKTKDNKQIRSHWQKYQQKLEKS